MGFYEKLTPDSGFKRYNIGRPITDDSHLMRSRTYRLEERRQRLFHWHFCQYYVKNQLLSYMHVYRMKFAFPKVVDVGTHTLKYRNGGVIPR